MVWSKDFMCCSFASVEMGRFGAVQVRGAWQPFEPWMQPAAVSDSPRLVDGEDSDQRRQEPQPPVDEARRGRAGRAWRATKRWDRPSAAHGEPPGNLLAERHRLGAG